MQGKHQDRNWQTSEISYRNKLMGDKSGKTLRGRDNTSQPKDLVTNDVKRVKRDFRRAKHPHRNWETIKGLAGPGQIRKHKKAMPLLKPGSFEKKNIGSYQMQTSLKLYHLSLVHHPFWPSGLAATRDLRGYKSACTSRLLVPSPLSTWKILPGWILQQPLLAVALRHNASCSPLHKTLISNRSFLSLVQHLVFPGLQSFFQSRSGGIFV